MKYLKYLMKGLFIGMVGILALVLVVWIRSYWVKDLLEWQGAAGPWELMSQRGTLELLTRDDVPGENPTRASWHRLVPNLRSTSVDTLGLKFRFAGMMYGEIPTTFTNAKSTGLWDVVEKWVAIPYWMLFVGIAIPVILLVMLSRMRHRGNLFGRCVVCGYDLRATPVRCPECGAVVNRSDVKREGS